MLKAHAVASTIISDHFELAQHQQPPTHSLLNAHPEMGAVPCKIKQSPTRVVGLSDWKRIDEAEVARVQVDGKPREKFTSVKDMLNVLD